MSANATSHVNIDIDIKLVNDLGSSVKGDASYLLKEIGDSNKALSEALKNLVQFADDAKTARNSGDVVEKGWKRNLKNIVEVLSKSGDQIKHISDGTSVLTDICKGLYHLAHQFNLGDVVQSLEHFIK